MKEVASAVIVNTAADPAAEVKVQPPVKMGTAKSSVRSENPLQNTPTDASVELPTKASSRSRNPAACKTATQDTAADQLQEETYAGATSSSTRKPFAYKTAANDTAVDRQQEEEDSAGTSRSDKEVFGSMSSPEKEDGDNPLITESENSGENIVMCTIF